MPRRHAGCRVGSGVLLFIAALVSWGRIASSATPELDSSARSWPAPSGWPVQPGLCDPLTMLDGRSVRSATMWTQERRPELVRLLQHYMYGTLPPRPELSARLERSDPGAFGGKASLSEVTLKFGPADAPPIHLLVIVPNRRSGPAPVILALNYFGNHTLVRDPEVRLPDHWMPEWGGDGARRAKVSGHRATEAGRGSWADLWPIEDLLDRGYALATFYNGDIDPDTVDFRVFAKSFPAKDPADQCGTIGAWAWGLQRAVDYLVTQPTIDRRRIVVTGHSRTGKAALVAAAFDERIAMAVPHQAGCGGSAPSRARLAIGQPWNTIDAPNRKQPETVADLNRAFPHWFSPRFKEFNDAPERLPFDQHCLVALCAPRPVLFSNGRADTWINPAGQFAVLRAAAPVYRLLAAGDFSATTLPADGEVVGDRLGYYLRPGGHSLEREDWRVFLDFADRHLPKPDRPGPPVQQPPEASRAGAAAFIEIDPAAPHSFRRSNGEWFFPLGDTAYFLIAQPTNVIARYFHVRREQGFNFVRVLGLAEGFWPFGGTSQRPDFSVVRENVLARWDWVFAQAEASGLALEWILWGYGAEGGEGMWKQPADVDRWIRTVVARFRHRPNLFLWTIANEFERYPDGKYRYEPGDVDWARAVAARIREIDPIHPIACHPSVWITDQDPPGHGPRPFGSYRGFTQRQPPVVWPLWAGSELHVNLTQNNEGVQRRTWGDWGAGRRGLTYHSTRWQGHHYPAEWTEGGWRFHAAGLEDCLAEEWDRSAKPVLNAEFGYQHEPGYENERHHLSRQCHHPDTVRVKAWKAALSGASFAAGFESTAVRHFRENDVLNARTATFRILHDFMAALPYWRMRPMRNLGANVVALAEPGQHYVLYLPEGGTASPQLPESSEFWTERWFNPRSGKFEPALRVAKDSTGSTFTAPDALDWILVLQRAD